MRTALPLMLAFFATSAFARAAPSSAQIPVTIEPGTRVKVRALGMNGRYRVVLAEPHQLSVRDWRDTTFVLPVASIEKLWVANAEYTGADAAMRGMVRGIGIGMAVGAVLGLYDGMRPRDGPSLDYGPGSTMLLGAFVTGAAGGVIGLVAGGASGMTKWERVPLAKPAALAPAGGVRLGVSLRF